MVNSLFLYWTVSPRFLTTALKQGVEPDDEEREAHAGGDEETGVAESAAGAGAMGSPAAAAVVGM
jgi:hypothetical protein